MAKSYTVQSVDAVAKTMVVQFNQDGDSLTLNIPVPVGSATVDDQVTTYWPTTDFARRADATAKVSAAEAAIGQVVAVN